MATDIASLGIRIDSLEAKVAAANLKNLATQAGKTEQSVTQMGKRVGQAVGAAAIAIGVMVKAAVNLADSTGKAAQSAGVGIEAFSELQYAARLGGVATAAFASNFTTLAKNIGEAANGTGRARGAFEQLGIKVRDASGHVLTAEEAFRLVADRFSRMQDGATKTAIAMKIFGDAGAKLIPTLNQGAKGLKDAAEEARKFGLVITDDVAAGATRFNDELDRIKAAAQGAALALAIYLQPVVTSLLNTVQAISASSFIGWLVTSGKESRNAGQIVNELSAELEELDRVMAEFEKANPLAKLWSKEDQKLREIRRKALVEKRNYLLEIQRSEALALGEGVTDTRHELRPAPFIPKPPGPTASEIAEANRIRKAQLASDIAGIERELDRLLASYKNTERLLEAARDAGLVSEADYYTEKRQMIQLETQAETNKLRDEITRLKQEKVNGDEKIKILKDIADAEALIIRKQNDASVATDVLSLQQQTSLQRQAASFKQAQASALEYYLSIQNAQNREIAGMGAGDQERRRTEGLLQIESAYQDQLQELNRSRLAATTDDQRKQIAEQENLVREFRAKALEGYASYYDRLLEKQKDFGVGAQEALQNFVDESANAAAQANNLISGAFNGAADAVANFVTTGKLEFKSFILSIIADLARTHAAKALSGLASAILSGFGGGFGSGNAFGNRDLGENLARGGIFDSNGKVRFATGGIVDRATPFRFANGSAGFSNGLMGEAGPEAIMPLKRGSDGKLGVAGGGGGMVTNHFSITVAAPIEPMSDWRLQKTMEESFAASNRKMLQRRGGN